MLKIFIGVPLLFLIISIWGGFTHLGKIDAAILFNENSSNFIAVPGTVTEIELEKYDGDYHLFAEYYYEIKNKKYVSSSVFHNVNLVSDNYIEFLGQSLIRSYDLFGGVITVLVDKDSPNISYLSIECNYRYFAMSSLFVIFSIWFPIVFIAQFVRHIKTET